MESKKFGYIDSLRGIAILLVIWVHIGVVLNNTTLYFPTDSFLFQFILSGQYGVQLFFVVSAFTLMISYYNRITEDHATRNFFIRRFFRIAPMYYLAIAYFTLDKYLQYDFSNFSEVPIRSLLSNLFFYNALIPEHINNYVPGGWSVSVEFMFYLLMPIICCKVRNFDSAVKLFAITFVIALIANLYIVENTYYPYFKSYNFIVQLPIFPMGIATYFYLRDKQVKLSKWSWGLIAIAIWTACFLVIPKHLYFGLFFAILLIIQEKYRLKVFSNKLLVMIGKVSFSMYLVHFAVIFMFNRFDFNDIITVDSYGSALLNFILMYILVVTITFVVSNVTYRAIEIPGQDLGRKIIKKLN